MRIKRAGFLTKIVVLTLLIYMATSLLNLRGRIQEVRQQQGDLQRQVTVQRVENEELSHAIEHSSDPSTLEEAARDRGYVRKDEDLFINIG